MTATGFLLAAFVSATANPSAGSLPVLWDTGLDGSAVVVVQDAEGVQHQCVIEADGERSCLLPKIASGMARVSVTRNGETIESSLWLSAVPGAALTVTGRNMGVARSRSRDRRAERRVLLALDQTVEERLFRGRGLLGLLWWNWRPLLGVV
jgi:hypothetical protein